MKEKSKKLFSKKNRTFNNIFFLCVLPSVILSISLLFTYIISYTHNKAQVKQSFTSSLKLFSQMCETKISSTISSCSYMYNSDVLMDYLQNKTTLNDTSTQYNISSLMTNFKNSNECLDCIYIIDKQTNEIITSAGVYPFSKFFNEIYSYEKYDSDYWDRFTFFGHDSFQILSPTALNNSKENNSVIIPIILRSFGDVSFSKYIVMNISLDKLLESNNQYSDITKNSSVFVMDRYSGDVFGFNNKYNFDNLFNSPLYDKLISGENYFDDDINGKKTLFVTCAFSDVLLGYTYFATVPYSDIYRMQSVLLIYTGVIFLLFLCVAIFMSFNNTKKIVTPIQSIASSLDSNVDNSNIFNAINSSIDALKQTNNNLSKTFPLALEKYLIDFLNSTEYQIDEQTRKILKSALPFEYNYFVSIVFKISPRKEFFNVFPLSAHNDIFCGLYNIIESMFVAHFNNAFFLSPDRETLYIILNCDEDFDCNETNKILDEIYDVIKFDNCYINVYTGIGSMRAGFDGLKESYTEAVESLKYVNFNTPHMLFSEDDTKNHVLNSNDEAKLLNALMSLDVDSANKLIKNHLNSDTDPNSLKYICMQIINIIFRAMQSKNILSSELLDEYILVIEKPYENVYKYISLLLSKIESFKQSIDSEKNGYAMIEYIKANFKDSSISLESIASRFSVTSGYVSRLIKKELNVGFHEYLTSLRIAYAKELLIESDKSIQKIGEDSGFFSNQTFFRVFKNKTGMTPSEYRKNNV